jgi:hypothetical protein
MFNSSIHSFTNLQGLQASMMPKATSCFAGICRIDWNAKGYKHSEQVSFSVNFDKNTDSPMHPRLDNC